MREHIKSLLTEAVPSVNFESDFLFAELDSLGIVTIIMILSKEYEISLGSTDVTPKNFKTLDAIVNLVQTKLSTK